MTLFVLVLLTSGLASAGQKCSVVKQDGKKCQGSPFMTVMNSLPVCEMICKAQPDSCEGYNVLSSCQQSQCACRFYKTCDAVDDTSETFYKSVCTTELQETVGTPLAQVLDLAAKDELEAFSDRLGELWLEVIDFNANLEIYIEDTAPKEDKTRLRGILNSAEGLLKNIHKAEFDPILFPDSIKQTGAKLKEAAKLMTGFQETSSKDANPKWLLETFDKAAKKMLWLSVDLVGVVRRLKDHKFAIRAQEFADKVVSPLAAKMRTINTALKIVLKTENKAQQMLMRLVEAMAALEE